MEVVGTQHAARPVSKAGEDTAATTVPAIAVHAALALAVVHGELHDRQVRVCRHEVIDALVDVRAGRGCEGPVGKGVVLVGEGVPDPLEQALSVREIGGLRPHAGCKRHKPTA